MNHLASRVDPLLNTDAFQTDRNGNPQQRTDRRGQVTTRAYDAMNRLHQVEFADASTITYTYDAKSRVTQ
jgi:YD repeat-containing protein